MLKFKLALALLLQKVLALALFQVPYKKLANEWQINVRYYFEFLFDSKYILCQMHYLKVFQDDSLQIKMR